MLPHWKEAYVTVNGAEFHYVRTGNNTQQPLLLLHGFSDNGLCWLPVARDLEDQFDVILPDARGHGRSTRVQPDEIIDNAADAAGLIAALELQKPIVGGHSMGGLAATELGARYPDLVKSLILEDPAWIDPSPDEVPLAENPFFSWLLNMDGISSDEIIEQGKINNPNWPDAEFPAWAESKRQLDKNIFPRVNVRKPWREFVAALTVPALLVTADVEKGAIVTPAAAQEATDLSPLLQVAQVPDAGHNIRRENYLAFMQAVQAFLNQ
ncbi:MAG: alpha/beta hydrolase [Ardenticatenaceae bacterium]|nr:alpha/beta hydrolase [Ardenticatenaceae bacterium]MCB9445910.1 alpha/beta hydrolase [Ardenticatenaceae bacterium]